MDYLPIKSISAEDEPLVGSDVVRLGRLARLGLPVADGVAVFPPDHIFKIIKYANLQNREVFEQNLALIREELKKIPVPPDFRKLLNSKGVRAEHIWTSLLEEWLAGLRFSVWNGDVVTLDKLKFLAQPVFFTGRIFSSGQVYIEPGTGEVALETRKGILPADKSQALCGIAREAQERLFLPFVYHWVLHGKAANGLALVKTSPFTQTKAKIAKQTLQTPVKKPLSATSATKIFADLSSGYVLGEGADGGFVRGEESAEYDDLALRLVEACMAYKDAPVIFRLSDVAAGGIRGSLRLLHKPADLDRDVGAYVFTRNKKQCLNLQLCVPCTRSPDEFLSMKRELAVRGATRKGSAKIYLEMGVPENLVQLDGYLTAGLDGAVLNLDELASWIGGFGRGTDEHVFYQRQAGALLKFLEEPMKLFRKNKMTVVGFGGLCFNDDILAFLIKNGITGVVTGRHTVTQSREVISFVEGRLVRR